MEGLSFRATLDAMTFIAEISHSHQAARTLSRQIQLEPMPTLFLLCGLPGSGKTTLAKQLEIQHNALRLSPDEWIVQILQDPADIVERGRLRSPVENIQWELAKRALVLGTNVILEFGFWSRQERDYFSAE